jgi:hypothetical protein
MPDRIPPEHIIKQAERELQVDEPYDASVAWGDEGHSGPGWYAYYTEYPDEGSVFLGTGETDA